MPFYSNSNVRKIFSVGRFSPAKSITVWGELPYLTERLLKLIDYEPSFQKPYRGRGDILETKFRSIDLSELLRREQSYPGA